MRPYRSPPSRPRFLTCEFLVVRGRRRLGFLRSVLRVGGLCDWLLHSVLLLWFLFPWWNSVCAALAVASSHGHQTTASTLHASVSPASLGCCSPSRLYFLTPLFPLSSDLSLTHRFPSVPPFLFLSPSKLPPPPLSLSLSLSLFYSLTHSLTDCSTPELLPRSLHLRTLSFTHTHTHTRSRTSLSMTKLCQACQPELQLPLTVIRVPV